MHSPSQLPIRKALLAGLGQTIRRREGESEVSAMHVDVKVPGPPPDLYPGRAASGEVDVVAGASQ